MRIYIIFWNIFWNLYFIFDIYRAVGLRPTKKYISFFDVYSQNFPAAFGGGQYVSFSIYILQKFPAAFGGGEYISFFEIYSEIYISFLIYICVFRPSADYFFKYIYFVFDIYLLNYNPDVYCLKNALEKELHCTVSWLKLIWFSESNFRSFSVTLFLRLLTFF